MIRDAGGKSAAEQFGGSRAYCELRRATRSAERAATTRGEPVNRFGLIGLSMAGLVVASGGDSDIKRADLWKKDAQAAVQAGQKDDPSAALPAFLQLTTDFPENSRALRNLAWTEQKAGNPDQAEKYLRMYAAMGTTLQPGGPIYKSMADAGILEKVLEIKRNGEAVTTGSLVFTLGDANLVAEDIGYDPATRHIFLSSVHEKKILECDSSGKCEDVIHALPEMPLNAILALHVDATRGVLWATTAGLNAEADFRPEYKGRSAVLKFDLRSHRLIHRFEPGDSREHAMGDMTVASNGDAYISDGESGDVYVVRHDGTKLESLVSAGVFVSPQTPALNGDETLLYVPDYVEGIALIHLKNGTIEWMKGTSPMALEGIDGLYWTKTGLIATQNGTLPERIVRFPLSADNRVSGFEALEANWPGLGDPTHGVVVGNDFYYIVNSGWDRVGDDGAIAPGKPASIWKMRIGSR